MHLAQIFNTTMNQINIYIKHFYFFTCITCKFNINNKNLLCICCLTKIYGLKSTWSNASRKDIYFYNESNKYIH